jgi:hypothetical protein
LTLQDAKVTNHGLNLRATERRERRHSTSRLSLTDDPAKCVVGQPLEIAAARDVGTSLSAPAVEPVAGRADGFKDLPAISLRPDDRCCGCAVLRLQSAGQEYLPGEGQQNQR